MKRHKVSKIAVESLPFPTVIFYTFAPEKGSQPTTGGGKRVPILAASDD